MFSPIEMLPEKLLQLLIQGCLLGVFAAITTIGLSRNAKLARYGLFGAFLPVMFLIGEATIRSVALPAWLAILLLIASRELPERAMGLRIPAIALGAILLFGWFIKYESLWLQAICTAGAICVSLAATLLEKRYHPFAINQLFLLTAGAILTTVPDTEEAALLVGLLIPATIVSGVYGSRLLNPAGSLPLTMILVWVICAGGLGRPASVITSIGCLGLLIVDPMIEGINRISKQTFRISAIGGLAYHCLSISIALGFARTTSDIGLAAIATMAALTIPLFLACLAGTIRHRTGSG